MMPRVLHVRDMPGYRYRRPTIPPTAAYIGRFNRTYGLAASMWIGDTTLSFLLIEEYEPVPAKQGQSVGWRWSHLGSP